MKSSPETGLQQLEPYAVSIATRKRQRFAIPAEHDDTLFLIRSGVFLARTSLPDGRHQILSIFYPGDCIRSAAMPPLDGTEITAATDTGEIWRLRWPAVEGLLQDDQELAREISHRLAKQTARLALHNTIIAGLSGDERVAALMTELALRVGKDTPAGIVFEMPLSRTDIAEHLALNADTVSRIVSRMRSNGLFAIAGRNRLVCRSLEVLARESPISTAIRRMHETASHRRAATSPACVTQMKTPGPL
jgi:CRP/FNR family transcriptional regulator